MPLTFSVPDTELSLTLEHRRAEVVDNIFEKSVFLNAMRERGGVMTVDGGRQYVQPLLFSKSTAVGSFSGYDILSTTPQANETSAVYDWAAYYATISIAWDEAKKNQGRAQLINLTNQKMDDAGMSIRDALNIDLMQAQPSSGSKDVNSLTEIIDEAPTADPARTASIGSIGNSNTWWRNQATSGGSFTVSDMNTVWNNCSQGSENPDFMLTGQTNFEYYENSQVGQIRYGDTRSMDAGFQNLIYKGSPMFFEPNIGNTDEIYFINTQYLKLVIMAGADFTIEPFVTPDNQAAKVAKILWMGQLVSSNRRRIGTLHGITAPA